MTVSDPTSTTGDVTSTARPLAIRRTLLATVVASLGFNLLIWAGARLAGAEFEVSRPGDEPMTVGPVTIALTTIAPLLLGGVALAIGVGRSPRVPILMAWLGLGVGVLTAPMPFTVQAGTDTQSALAAMHLVTGAVWWLALHRSSR